MRKISDFKTPESVRKLLRTRIEQAQNVLAQLKLHQKELWSTDRKDNARYLALFVHQLEFDVLPSAHTNLSESKSHEELTRSVKGINDVFSQLSAMGYTLDWGTGPAPEPHRLDNAV